MTYNSESATFLRPACGSGENYKILPLKFQKAFLLSINNILLTFFKYSDEYRANRTLANGLYNSFALDGQIYFCCTETVNYKNFKSTLRPIFSRTSRILVDLTNNITLTDCQTRHKTTLR
jgi:hypothetical protein